MTSTSPQPDSERERFVALLGVLVSTAYHRDHDGTSHHVDRARNDVMQAYDAARTPPVQPEALGYVTLLTAKHRHGIMTPEPRATDDVPLYTAPPDRVRREALEEAARMLEIYFAQSGDVTYGALHRVFCDAANVIRSLATKGQS